MENNTTCHTCLWWWDLYDTGEWICYNRDSKLFHEKTKIGCKHHECKVTDLIKTHPYIPKPKKKER